MNLMLQGFSLGILLFESIPFALGWVGGARSPPFPTTRNQYELDAAAADDSHFCAALSIVTSQSRMP